MLLLGACSCSPAPHASSRLALAACFASSSWARRIRGRDRRLDDHRGRPTALHHL
jgi:hypothetical protein